MEMTFNPSQTRHSAPPCASRIAGRGRLLRQLAALSRRVDRFAAHRASSDAECRWAALLADQLDSAYAGAIAAPGAHAALAAVERRAETQRKARTP